MLYPWFLPPLSAEVLQLLQPALQCRREAQPLRHLRSRRLGHRELRRVHPGGPGGHERLPLGVGEQGWELKLLKDVESRNLQGSSSQLEASDFIGHRLQMLDSD